MILSRSAPPPHAIGTPHAFVSAPGGRTPGKRQDMGGRNGLAAQSLLEEFAMTDTTYEFQDVAGGVPIKSWTRGVPVDDKAREQLARAAKMPFIFKHVAAMPDVHVGIGATVGSVIPTRGAVIPAAVGVDIGCGMMAARTSLVASDLPDNLAGIRSAIEAAVGHLLAQGIERRLWQVAGDNSVPVQNETLDRYLTQNKVVPEEEE